MRTTTPAIDTRPYFSHVRPSVRCVCEKLGLGTRLTLYLFKFLGKIFICLLNVLSISLMQGLHCVIEGVTHLKWYENSKSVYHLYILKQGRKHNAMQAFVSYCWPGLYIVSVVAVLANFGCVSSALKKAVNGPCFWICHCVDAYLSFTEVRSFVTQGRRSKAKTSVNNLHSACPLHCICV